MNKNKISQFILDSVETQNNKSYSVIAMCDDFLLVKKFLLENNFSFTPYRFANCFHLHCDHRDLSELSNFCHINFIYPNISVRTINNLDQTNCLSQPGTLFEKDYIHYQNLTNNKHFGQGQTICFIDTGIYPHLDFILPYNKIIKFVDLINLETSPYDDNGHGTFVSGLACGSGIFSNRNQGFAPHSKIISIKALDKKGSSTSNVILDAMEWIYQYHKVYNIGVVCMSIGANVDNTLDPLSKGAEALWRKGIVVVSAAGNNGPNNETIMSPGNNPNIITVGGLDYSNHCVASFSSRGPTSYGIKPDLVAPAVNLSSCNNSFPPYTRMSGTSVATPIIAGIAAVIKSRYPNLTNKELKEYLLSHCTKLTGDKNSEGAGYINFQ